MEKSDTKVDEMLDNLAIMSTEMYMVMKRFALKKNLSPELCTHSMWGLIVMFLYEQSDIKDLELAKEYLDSLKSNVLDALSRNGFK